MLVEPFVRSNSDSNLNLLYANLGWFFLENISSGHLLATRLTSLILKTYSNISEEPFTVYQDILENQKHIKLQLNGLAGIYGWFNIDNNKIYIGSAKDLGKRPFKHLYESSHTNQHLYNAIQKYSLNKFLLVIFLVRNQSKLVTKPQLIQMEDYYLSSIPFGESRSVSPEAYTSLGYKHSDHAKSLIKFSKLGKNMSDRRIRGIRRIRRSN